MKAKLKLITTFLLLIFAVNVFSQPKNRTTNRDRKAKAIEPLNPMGAAKWEWAIQCDCTIGPIMQSPTKTFQNVRDMRWVYKDYVCPNCSTVWEIKTDEKTNEILRGPYIPMRQHNQQTDTHEVIPDSCYTCHLINTELTNTINGVEYKGTCIKIKSHCKHNKHIYILIRNEINGRIYYRALGANDCGYNIEYGDRYSVTFTHYPEKIENAIGMKINLWQPMQYCQ